MPTIHNEQSQGLPSDIQIKKKKKKSNKKKKKNGTSFLTYVYLFAMVFLVALWGLSNAIKTYSPDVDVTIGNNDAYTISDVDSDIEMKTIDERLKWIQMEDELPTVSVKGIQKAENNEEKTEKNEKTDKSDKTAKYTGDNSIENNKRDKKQNVSEKTKKQESIDNNSQEKLTKDILKEDIKDFKAIPAKEVIEKPKPAITKVYLGNFSTLEEAIVVQGRINEMEPGITPFVKSVNGHYIVQLGSFSDSERAGALSEKLKSKGYYPKIKYEN